MKNSNRHLKGGSSGMHTERRITLDSIRFGDVLAHPLTLRVYGKPKPTSEMLSSIEKVGILQPLTINETEQGKYELLVGNTRREAWRLLYEEGKVQSQWIPCRFVNLTPLEAEQIVLESNRQRVKTPEQKAREYKELKRIEQGLLAENEKPKGNTKSARAVGMGERSAEKMQVLIDKADEGEEQAVQLLADVNSKKTSISKAYAAITDAPEPTQSLKSFLKPLQTVQTHVLPDLSKYIEQIDVGKEERKIAEKLKGTLDAIFGEAKKISRTLAIVIGKD